MNPIDQQYLDLLNKYFQGNISPEENVTLEKLIREDNDRELLFHYLKHTPLERDKSPQEIKQIYDRSKTIFQDYTVDNTSKPLGIIKIKKHLYMVAAVAVFFLIGAWLFSSYLNGKSEQWDLIQTTKGERRFFKLEDGSEGWLNSESCLKVKKGYGVAHRQMELTGEAYFIVTKNQQLPFIVKTNNTEVKVLGTVFNLKSYPEDQSTVATLVEGKIMLRSEFQGVSKDYILTPGDIVKVSETSTELLQQHKTQKDKSSKPILEGNSGSIQPQLRNDDDLELLWIKNKLVFNGDRLTEMTKKMERWYNKTIIIQSKSLGDRSFTGVFEEDRCEQVLDLLKATGVPIDYEVKNDTLYIK